MKTTDDKIKKKIGLRIQTLRKQLGMTAADLRQATGIGLSTLQNYEAGLRHPSIDAIQKIANALKAPASYIACLTDEQYPEPTTEAPIKPGLVPIESDIASPGTTPTIAFDRSLLKSKSINPANLSMISNHDELMAPTIQDGAQVVIDTSIKTINNSGIYALEGDNGIIMLRHCRVIPGDNVIMLSTQSDAESNTIFLKNEDLLCYHVIGRVVSVVNWL